MSLGFAGTLVLGCTACGAGKGSGEKGGSQYVGTVLEITYTQQAGSAFLVAENPSTGHTFRYLVVVIDTDA